MCRRMVEIASIFVTSVLSWTVSAAPGAGQRSVVLGQHSNNNWRIAAIIAANRGTSAGASALSNFGADEGVADHWKRLANRRTPEILHLHCLDR